ncbi:MAG: hypothetical protein J0G94_09030 [Sphingomonadales bacterium]|nr:hypothetical protein [Sphingomonadales bacterium]
MTPDLRRSSQELIDNLPLASSWRQAGGRAARPWRCRQALIAPTLTKIFYAMSPHVEAAATDRRHGPRP